MVFSDMFKSFSDVIIDAYYTVDREGKILDYNRAFYALFPRNVARKLKGKRIREVMEIERDISQECVEAGRHVRLDEIMGTVKDSDEEIRMILSAIPIEDETETAALVILRNVTDEAAVQIKYQEMLETEARERERLMEKVRMRTEQLLSNNEVLLKTQKELVNYKKGILL